MSLPVIYKYYVINIQRSIKLKTKQILTNFLIPDNERMAIINELEQE